MAKTPTAPRIKVELTEDEILNGVKRDSSHCMFAEAVKAAQPDATHIAVDLQTVRFSDPKKGLRYVYLTPRSMQVALVNFDQGHLPAPFTITLRNGQVTSQSKRVHKPVSEAQRKARKEAGKKGAAKKKELSKMKLVGNRDHQPGRVVGGKTPPTTPFARRRAFGLRALER